MTISECYCDYPSEEFYVRETLRARKEHRCEECSREIEQGEIYEHVRGKWDGGMYSFNTCQHCLALIEFVKSHVPCFCGAKGALLDSAIETAQEYAHEAPGLLFGAYRRLVKIEQRKEEQQCLRKKR